MYSHWNCNHANGEHGMFTTRGYHMCLNTNRYLVKKNRYWSILSFDLWWPWSEGVTAVIWIHPLETVNMVNGLYLYATFLVLATTKSALQHKSAFTRSHVYSYADGRGYHARCHLLIRANNHSCTLTHRWRPTGSNAGFSIYSKETLACWVWEAEDRTTDPLIRQCPLYLISNSRHDIILNFFCHARMLFYRSDIESKKSASVPRDQTKEEDRWLRH